MSLVADAYRAMMAQDVTVVIYDTTDGHVAAEKNISLFEDETTGVFKCPYMLEITLESDVQETGLRVISFDGCVLVDKRSGDIGLYISRGYKDSTIIFQSFEISIPENFL